MPFTGAGETGAAGAAFSDTRIGMWGCKVNVLIGNHSGPPRSTLTLQTGVGGEGNSYQIQKCHSAKVIMYKMR